MALDTCLWTWINHFFIWGSIVFYFLYTLATYSSTAFNNMPATFPSVGAAENTFGSGVFWAALLVTSIICLLPVLGYRWCKQKLYPTFTEYVRRDLWKEKRPPKTGVSPFHIFEALVFKSYNNVYKMRNKIFS